MNWRAQQGLLAIFITAINPDRLPPGRQLDINQLISISINTTFNDVAPIVNRVQRRQQPDADEAWKLLRKRYCHFYFPRALPDQPRLARDMHPKYPISMMEHAMNPAKQLQPGLYHGLVGQYRYIDTSPCNRQAAVIHYVGKRVGEAKKKSQSYRDVTKCTLPLVNSARGVVGFVVKFMNRLIAERDWAAQEYQHSLLNLVLTRRKQAVITAVGHHP